MLHCNLQGSWQAEQDIYKLPRMEHDNILQFMGVVHTPLKREYWLMTKFHSRGSLCDFLKSNTVTFTELLKVNKMTILPVQGHECLCSQVAHSMSAGLAYLHEELPIRGVEDLKPAVAHRDFKSKNVLIKDDLTACIGDFGLAIIFEPGKSCGETHGQVSTSYAVFLSVSDVCLTGGHRPLHGARGPRRRDQL